jgi:hypothetical protein
MFKHAGIEGILAGIPTAILMVLKDSAHVHLGRAVHGAISRAEGVAGEAVTRASGRFRISAPVVIGAVIVTAAVVHGALRGMRSYETRSFADEEVRRREAADQSRGQQRA